MMLNHQDMKSNKQKFKLISFFKLLPLQINKELKKFKKFKVNNKNKKLFDPVTNVDRFIEKFIRDKIIKSYPDHKILGEEMKEKRSKSNHTWIIDPIDGTKNFIMGVPTWSNLVGLYYKGKSIISLANFPLLNTYYLAFNQKAYKFEKNKKKLIKCNKKNKKKPNIVLNTLRPYKKPKIKKIENKFKGIFKVSGADALNFCLLSEGKIDILIEKGLKKVDFFPLMSIIENSGALITDWNGEKKFKNGDVLVSGNKKNHLKILKILKK